MKKTNTLIFLITILVTLSVNAQKIKIKKGNITVDGVLMFKTDRGIFTGEKSLYDLNDNELVFIKWDHFNDPNTGEEIKYCSISFPDLELKTEVDLNTFKGQLRLMFKNKIFKDNTLVKEKVARFVKKYGLEFTKKRNELSQGKVIIINEAPTQQKGVNISIGY